MGKSKGTNIAYVGTLKGLHTVVFILLYRILHDAEPPVSFFKITMQHPAMNFCSMVFLVYPHEASDFT